jgi:hypothetical protein
MLPGNIFRRIAPVGNPISLKTAGALPAMLDDPRIRLVQSGTAALAAAVNVAKMARCVDGTPEVIIPAYCCPDVVAAVVFNGCKPVMVDFSPGRPQMDPAALERAITARSIAVIAVNFLGIPERCRQIREIIATSDIVLIEDSAQWFPEQGDLFGNYEGDLVIVSFGKGKPVSLLGGGAVICRNPALPFGQLQIAPPERNRSTWQLRLLFLAYNLVIHPWFYWLLELLPFIEIGATRFHALDYIAEIEPAKKPFLSANIAAYQRRTPEIRAHVQRWNDCDFARNACIAPLCEEYRGQRLLRFPVLATGDNETACTLADLMDHGLGVSALYETILPDIEGIPADITAQAQGAFDNARDFARRLFTLPTHAYAGTAIEFLRRRPR